MATTKKAPTRTRRASVAKKSVSKKTAKKAVKKTTKKVASKKLAHKKTTKKKSSTKTNLAPKKLKPTKKETLLKKGGVLAFPRSISLALFTPLVPLNPDQIAIGVARLGGAALVLVGMFFAGLHTLKLGGLFAALQLGQNCTQSGACTYMYAEGQPASLASALDGLNAFFARPLYVPAEVLVRLDLIILSVVVLVGGLMLLWLALALKDKRAHHSY